jgi:flagellar biosynthesis protein FlhG
MAFREIAKRAEKWQTPNGPRGHVEFFMERLIPTARSATA